MTDPKGYYAAYGLRPPKPRPKAKRNFTPAEMSFGIRLVAFALFMTVTMARLLNGMDWSNNERHLATYMLILIALHVSSILKEKP